jgi:hypothetical protein
VVEAVCADPIPGYEVVKSTASIAPAAVITTEAECPSGKIVLGGGSRVVNSESADFKTVLISSAPETIDEFLRTGWRVKITNQDPFNGHSIETDAICALP